MYIDPSVCLSVSLPPPSLPLSLPLPLSLSLSVNFSPSVSLSASLSSSFQLSSLSLPLSHQREGQRVIRDETFNTLCSDPKRQNEKANVLIEIKESIPLSQLDGK
jgi:hypothetical protein